MKIREIPHQLFAGDTKSAQMREHCRRALLLTKDEAFSLIPDCSVPITVSDKILKEFTRGLLEKRKHAYSLNPVGHSQIFKKTYNH